MLGITGWILGPGETRGARKNRRRDASNEAGAGGRVEEYLDADSANAVRGGGDFVIGTCRGNGWHHT